jgi:hypothetical protein
MQKVQESGLIFRIHQPRGGTLESQAPPLSHYPTHPQRDPSCILYPVSVCGTMAHPGLRIQSLEKWFSGCLGDMQDLMMCGGMDSIWLLVMSLEKC